MQVQTLLNKIIRTLAVQAYEKEDQDRKSLTQGSGIRRAFGTRTRAQVTTVEEIVVALKNGAFDRGAQLAIDNRVTRSDAMTLVEIANKLSITGEKATWKAVAAQQDRRKKAFSSMMTLVSHAGDLNGVIESAGKLARIPLSTLRGIWEDLLEYYYNADYDIWPTEEEIKKATTQGSTGGRIAMQRRLGVMPSAPVLSRFARKPGVSTSMPESKRDAEEKEDKGRAGEEGEEKSSLENPQEAAVNSFLKDGVFLSQLIGVIEEAIANSFKTGNISEEFVKKNLSQAVVTLQDAYLYQYSGFMPSGALESLQSFTSTLIERIDTARLSS